MRVYFVVFWVKKNEPLRMGTRNRGSFKRATKFVVKILTSSLIAWQNKYNQNEIIDPFVTTMQWLPLWHISTVRTINKSMCTPDEPILWRTVNYLLNMLYSELWSSNIVILKFWSACWCFRYYYFWISLYRLKNDKNEMKNAEIISNSQDTRRKKKKQDFVKGKLHMAFKYLFLS